MSKAIQGIAELGGAAILGGLMLFPGTAEFFNNPIFYKALESLALGGLAMEAGAIAGALTENRGMDITTRQAAGFRQIIYGTQRVGGNLIYASTTGGHHDQYNHVIVISGNFCDSIVNLYLDGRQVFWKQGSYANTTRNGVNFGGDADGNDHVGPNGVKYNFGGLVFCEARYGDQLPGDVMQSLTANDPIWAASATGSPYLGGCTYVYLKIEDSAAQFPQNPEIKFTVNGKPVYDPRTGTTAFSTNWALIAADVITDPVFGLGDDRVNQAQLIAAANVCDEQVALGGNQTSLTEARYTTSYHYDTSSAPGDVITTMLEGAAGRIVDSGGEYFLYPAYWQGPSFTFDEGSLAGTISYEERGRADLFNRVNGTYTAPNYPYNVTGNEYDSNGFYQGQIQDNFSFAFQSTNYPQYACDVLHGYASDQYLTEDGGAQLPKELPLPTVLSVSQCQRVAKINLLRNRQKGFGTFPMFIDAYRMHPTDVMNFTFPFMGWSQKVFEITGVNLKLVDAGEGMESLQTEIEVQETDPSIYAWSASEELTVYDVPATPSQTPYTPAAPTEMSLISGAQTEITGPDGIARPRIEVTWDSPLDVLTKQIQVQYTLSSAPTAWVDAGSVDVGLNLTYIAGVISGQTYNVRIRSVRANGAFSVWLEEDGYVVSASNTRIGSVYLNPNSPYNVGNNVIVNSFADGGAATVQFYGLGGPGSTFNEYIGTTLITLTPGEISGLPFSTFGSVVYDTFNLTYRFLTNFTDTLNDNYIFVGSCTTCDPTYTGVGGSGTGAGTSGGGGSTPGGGRNPVSIEQEASVN